MPEVKGPSSHERMLHELTHTPYRPWCKHCVAGRGKTRYHLRRESGKEGQIPQMCLDYGFLGDRAELQGEDGPEYVKVLTMKEQTYSAYAFEPVPIKGAGHKHNVKMVIQIIKEWGLGDLVMKSDGEPAIIDVKRQMKEKRERASMLE